MGNWWYSTGSNAASPGVSPRSASNQPQCCASPEVQAKTIPKSGIQVDLSKPLVLKPIHNHDDDNDSFDSAAFDSFTDSDSEEIVIPEYNEDADKEDIVAACKLAYGLVEEVLKSFNELKADTLVSKVNSCEWILDTPELLRLFSKYDLVRNVKETLGKLAIKKQGDTHGGFYEIENWKAFRKALAACIDGIQTY